MPNTRKTQLVAALALLVGGPRSGPRRPPGLRERRRTGDGEWGGSLRVVSTPAFVRRFAGAPDRIIPIIGYESPRGGYGARDYYYRFPRGGTIQYYLVDPKGHWIFEGFETSLRRFHTARGTRAGMSVREARRREKIRRLSSLCGGPALLRNDRRALLGMWVSRSRVSELFMLGRAYPFAFC